MTRVFAQRGAGGFRLRASDRRGLFDDEASGCTVVADARIDNRDELRRALGLKADGELSDARLILAAWLAWNEDCPNRLLGDFAFVIRDRRAGGVFAARDPFGLRPLYYAQRSGRLLALASTVDALLAMPEVDRRIHEPRIADYLVGQLEGVDLASTFFEDVFRLPAGHAMFADAERIRLRRYWRPEPGPRLELGSDAEYAEAFAALLEQAVACRLHGPERIASMLSGGVDSGAVVAVARARPERGDDGPLATFSGVDSGDRDNPETAAIHASQAMGGLAPRAVDLRDPAVIDRAAATFGDAAEPFDAHMTMLRAIYAAAADEGFEAVLDGAAADVVLAGGSRVARLVRSGRLRQAVFEARGLQAAFGDPRPVHHELVRAARAAVVPDWLRRLRRRVKGGNARARLRAACRDTLICPDFAARIDLVGRLDTLASHASPGLDRDASVAHAATVQHPYLAVARERYQRVAALFGVTPRDPFTDRRLVEFCVRLPLAQRCGDGWNKVVLRRALAGRLPDAVRWRQGKQHFGWAFTRTMMDAMREPMREAIEQQRSTLAAWIDLQHLDSAWKAWRRTGDEPAAEQVLAAAQLAYWLQRADLTV